MKNLLNLRSLKSLFFMAIALVMLNSCESDEELCYVEMGYIYESSSVSAPNNSNFMRVSQTVIQSPLSGDVFITGDAIANGGINTNGYDIVVEGDLVVNGSLNGASNSTIEVSGVFDLNGSMNMNGMNIYCDTAIVFGSLNGPGYIYYCSQKDFTGSKNNNNPNNQNIFQQSTHCGVLSNNDMSFDGFEQAPCDYDGRVVNGKKWYSLQ